MSTPNTISSLINSILYILIALSLVAIIIFIFIKIKKIDNSLKSKTEIENKIKNLPNTIVDNNDVLGKLADVNNITGYRDVSKQFETVYSSNLESKVILAKMKNNLESESITVNGNSFGKDYIDYNITNICNVEVTDVQAFNSFKIDNNSITYTECNLFFDSAFDTMGDLFNINSNFNVSDIQTQNLKFNDVCNLSSKGVTIPSSNAISILNDGDNIIHTFGGSGDASHSGDVNIRNCIYFNDDIDPASFEKNKICENGLIDNIDKKVTFQNDIVYVNGDMNTSNLNIQNNTVYSDNSSNMYIMNNMGEKFLISLNKWS